MATRARRSPTSRSWPRRSSAEGGAADAAWASRYARARRPRLRGAQRCSPRSRPAGCPTRRCWSRRPPSSGPSRPAIKGRGFKIGDEVAVWERAGVKASTEQKTGLTMLTLESPTEGEKVTRRADRRARTTRSRSSSCRPWSTASPSAPAADVTIHKQRGGRYWYYWLGGESARLATFLVISTTRVDRHGPAWGDRGVRQAVDQAAAGWRLRPVRFGFGAGSDGSTSSARKRPV